MVNLEKKSIRNTILEIRNYLKSEEVDKLSGEIMSNLIKIPIFEKSKKIMVYLSFKNEVDTFKLISFCQKKGKDIIVPFTIEKDKRIVPSLIKDIDKELVKSKFGYLQPSPEHLKPIDDKEIDLIIVPGVAFDRLGYRIGFGGGYYDRFLSKLKHKVTTIGLAYDFQIISRVPAEEFDIPLDYIVTEKRIIVGQITS